MTKWTVGYDGPSRPIILGPEGQIFSISKFINQKWQSFADEEAACQALCDAMNIKPPYGNPPMTIADVQRINKERSDRWHNGDMNEWNALEWAGAMCGEAGEAANAAKKLRRLELKIKSINLADRDLKTEHEARMKVAKECADTIFYALCLISRVNVDAECVLRDVFNSKSEEYEFPERI